MRRRLRLSLTMQGGIIFGAVMLCLVIALVIMLFSGPQETDQSASADTVWAQVLTSEDIARLESARDASPQPEN